MTRENKIKLEAYRILRTNRTGEFSESDLIKSMTEIVHSLNKEEFDTALLNLEKDKKIFSRLVGDPSGDYVQLKYSLTKKGNGLHVAIPLPEITY